RRVQVVGWATAPVGPRGQNRLSRGCPRGCTCDGDFAHPTTEGVDARLRGHDEEDQPPSAKNFSRVNGSGCFAGSRGSTPEKREASKCHWRRGGRPQARLRVYEASQRTGSFSTSIIW